MENLASIIISSILSGILATVITLWWQNRSEKIKVKREIFTTIMAYRFKIPHAESVKALNCVQAIFHNDKDVLKAWNNFINAADKNPFIAQDLTDAYIVLLEEISKVLNYNNIVWKDIKNYYYPEYLANEMNDTEKLRKAQLEAALSNVDKMK
ncbi:MAG: hypothetical protein IKV73_03050 [Clostridia bacterium]|nr:hypothetical protein [Clostridia bacterium]